MITYEDFEKHILFLKRQSEYNERLRALYREFSDVVLDADTPIEESWYMQIELLEKLLGIEQDSSGYSTLLWWAQEQEFGEKPDEPLMKSYVAPDESFDFTSIQGIYDFLVKEAEWTRAGQA